LRFYDVNYNLLRMTLLLVLSACSINHPIIINIIIIIIIIIIMISTKVTNSDLVPVGRTAPSQ